eukprot:1169483-Rhodomonas_salina.1
MARCGAVFAATASSYLARSPPQMFGGHDMLVGRSSDTCWKSSSMGEQPASAVLSASRHAQFSAP